MAVALDNSGSVANSSSATITLSLTISGSATLLVVYILSRMISTNTSGFGVTGVTANGVAMTRTYTSPDYSSSAGVEVYELVSPPTGTVSIVATRAAAGAAPGVMFGKSYTGTDTTTPVPGGWTRVTGNSANASPYTKTQAITTTTGDMTDEAICAALNFSQCVTSAGFQTEDQSLNDSNSTKCRTGHLAGAGSSVTHSYDLTADASGRIAYILYANIVQGAGGGGGAQGAGTLAKMAGRRGKQMKRMAA